ncbi:MAG TPA: sugar phosphate nucleotidyltransferase [Thermoplasmata archaeon]|nr:sugar phosphate nucleotidyltransferase [Thermoplasmata archaeon]
MQAVVTLAGEGTRMLPWTRGPRKEFLPLFDRGEGGGPVLKPVAHLVVETLVRAGADRFTLVVQPKDREFVRGYFAVDRRLLARHRDHEERLTETRRFYRTLEGLRFHYAVQPRPAGFGDAVLRSRPFVGDAPFLLQAGDAVLLEPQRGHVFGAMARLLERERLDGVLLVRRVSDPRRYGVIEGTPGPRFEGIRRLDVTTLVEKPEHPRTHWAATAAYVFRPSLFAALAAFRRAARPRELELTDGIRTLIDRGGRVSALVLEARWGEWRSVGSPDGFVRALDRSRRRAARPPVRHPNG